jgi:hypothetical protein
MFNSSGYPRRIDEQIDEYISPPPVSDIIDSNGDIILTANLLLNYLYHTYGNYKTNAPLSHLWFMYDAIHRADFLKAYAAWTATYNPLDNYNGSETNVYLTNDGNETETITHGKTTTTTANNITNETAVTTFDSNTYKPEGKNEQTGSSTDAESGTTTTQRDRTGKSLTVDGETYTADNVHAELKKRSGNLGVTTSQQMITSEIDMRLNPLVIMYIDTFISEYAYCILGEWGSDYDN